MSCVVRVSTLARARPRIDPATRRGRVPRRAPQTHHGWPTPGTLPLPMRQPRRDIWPADAGLHHAHRVCGADMCPPRAWTLCRAQMAYQISTCHRAKGWLARAPGIAAGLPLAAPPSVADARLTRWWRTDDAAPRSHSDGRRVGRVCARPRAAADNGQRCQAVAAHDGWILEKGNLGDFLVVNGGIFNSDKGLASHGKELVSSLAGRIKHSGGQKEGPATFARQR